MRNLGPLLLMAALLALGGWLVAPFWAGNPPERADVGPGEVRDETARRPALGTVRTDARIEPRGDAGSSAVDGGPLKAKAGSPPPQPVALPSSLVVAISNTQDEPLDGVRVTLRPGTRRERVGVTGLDGEVAFEDLRAGSIPYLVEAPGRPALRPAAAVELAPGEMQRLELHLDDHDRVIAGRVLDRQGAPVGGLTVKARLYRPPAEASILVPESQAEQSAESDDQGAFEIAGLAAGEYEVRSLANNRYLSAQAIVRAGTGATLLRVVERLEIEVVGQVTDFGGRPLVGASVVYFGPPGRRVRTDRDGRYRLLVADDVELARHRFVFRAAGHSAEIMEVPAAELSGLAAFHLDAALEPLGQTVAATGRVIDEQGQPVAEARVVLRSADLNSHYQAVSSTDGIAAFPEVAAGSDYAVHVMPQGPYEDYSGSGIDLSIDGATFDIALETLGVGRLSGRMVDPTGAPLPAFAMRLTSAQARAHWHQVNGDADGYFEVEAVPAGRLTFDTPSTPHLRVTGVSLDAGGANDVELVLDWGASDLEGRVVDAGGMPLPGAQVALHWADDRGSLRSRSTRQTISDSQGLFRFSRLGRAPHRLMANAPGHVVQQEPVPAGTAWIEVRLEPDRQ